MQKLNPLKNYHSLRKLNPHALIVKKYARVMNEQRRAAREVLRKKRSGEKVDANAVKKACTTLGLKNRTYKQMKAAIAKKRTDVNARRVAIKAKREKNAAYRKTRATTAKGTKSAPKKPKTTKK